MYITCEGLLLCMLVVLLLKLAHKQAASSTSGFTLLSSAVLGAFGTHGSLDLLLVTGSCVAGSAVASSWGWGSVCVFAGAPEAARMFLSYLCLQSQATHTLCTAACAETYALPASMHNAHSATQVPWHPYRFLGAPAFASACCFNPHGISPAGKA
jgi:hypothetical protein